MLWRFAERVGAKGVSFAVSVVLARLLMPEQYGVVSLILVLTNLLWFFVDTGFSNALIQKKDADQLDFSSVFYVNLALGCLIYLMLFVAAPSISRFYQIEMTVYIRVLGLTLVFGSVKSVQQAVVAVRLQFKLFFYSTIIGTITSAVVGIVMAYNGMGTWALIGQILTNDFLDMAILWITVGWKPSLQFSLERLKPLFAFGSRIFLANLFCGICDKMSGLMIGKLYSPQELAYYDKSQNMSAMITDNLGTAVQSVLLPVMSQEQNNIKKLRSLLRRSVMTSSFLIFPCMFGLAACAGPLVRILLTEKWSPMIPYMQLWCITYAPKLVYYANMQAIQAVGRSDIYLKLQIIQESLVLFCVLIGAVWGIFPLLIAGVICAYLKLVINAWPGKALIDYGVFDQIRDLTPYLLLSLIMGLVTLSLERLHLSDPVLLPLQVVTGIMVYLLGSVLFRVESLSYVLQTAKGILKKQS